MQYVRSPTATVGYGMCLGMGGFLLACGGEKGYRYAMPHSILMMHHPSGAARGQASEMHIESRELVRMRDYLSLLVSDHTGQPYDRVIRELSRNKWMNPKEAIEYGMIDKVRVRSGERGGARIQEQDDDGEAFFALGPSSSSEGPRCCPRPPARCALPASARRVACALLTTDRLPRLSPNNDSQKVLTTPMPKMPQLGPKFKFERTDLSSGGGEMPGL